MCSPSTYKEGICRVTMPYPEYSGGSLKGELHRGIDIVCGRNASDRMVACEDGEIVKIIEGSKNVSGEVHLKSDATGMTIKYKHVGKFKRKDGELNVKVGDKVAEGDVIGTPDWSNNSSWHIHFEVWDGNNHESPEEYLLDIDPGLKFEISDSYDADKWYPENKPELYERMKNAGRI